MVERREVHYRGQVQGVGFRYTAVRIANRHSVAGYVKNLPDGRVELVAQGESAALDAYLADVEKAMRGYIDDVEVRRLPADESLGGFGVRY